MNDKLKIFRHPALMLPLLICLIGAASAGTSIFILFKVAIEEDKSRLTQIVSSQARLMEAVAQFDELNSSKAHPYGAFGATLEQIVSAHKSLDGFGKTGEFVIGKLIDGKVAILQKSRYRGDINFQIQETPPLPMQKALAGESGEIIALDYKGNQVLAAYEHVKILNIGLVAKVDTDEVYHPFIVSAYVAAALTFVMLLVGVYASRKFSLPFIQLEQEKLRAEEYLNIAGTIILALDENGNIKMINRKGREVLGYTKDQLIGSNWFETAIPEEQRDYVKQIFSQLMSGNLKPVENVENEIIDRDGKTHLISWHNTYIKDKNGNITGCLSAGDDVTEYKKSQTALQTSETRFNKSQGFANIGTWDWNVQTGELYWSDRIAPLFGYATGALETTYDNFLAAIHPEDRQSVVDAVGACVESGAEYNIEHRVIWPDGTVRWLHERGDVVRDDHGKPLNMLGVVQDITARKWSEDEINRLSRRNELILNAAGDGIYGVNTKGECTFINPAAAEMLGYDPQELIDKKLHDLLHHTKTDGSRYPGSECPIYQAFHDGAVRAVSDEVFWKKDGSSFSVEYTSTPIVEDGAAKGAVVVFRNIDERKEMHAQLIQSSKLATLGEMATGVAHELNQPLNVIGMVSNNILRKLDKGKVDAEYLTGKLDKLTSQVTRASAIIDHMRIFGRKPGLTPILLDPKDMVDNVLGLIGEQLRLSEIEVVTEKSHTCRPILGHQVQLEQVLLNLLGNARDSINHREDGEKRISIAINDTDDTVTIAIQDTGEGIDGAILPRIFEPFFTTKEVGKGTGLGLSISYGIINEMGGTITARNTDGGACFTITLPAAEREQSRPIAGNRDLTLETSALGR
ncbi:MAG: PAS domain S-box protein [Rhodospirillales bacterium]|nr:PAS domain S-box protein [Rhodospirillales bacterium]